jgi:type IV pilus assembly protein PilP
VSRLGQFWRVLGVVAVGGALIGVAACGEDPPKKKEAAAKAPKVATPGKPVKATKSRRGAPPPAPADTAPPPPPRDFQDSDFVETEQNRDPFRSFADLFAARENGRVRAQRTVVMEDYSVDELKLIGVVSRINPAKAMLVDPKGQGHVVHRGDFVGKAERVQATNADAEFELNWRIDRIREADLVLVREDPSNPDVPSATRVIALRPEEGPLD